VAGATAGVVTQSPVKAFLIGVISHIILDMIPHHDHESVINCVLDVITGTAVFLLVVVMFRVESSLIWGAVGGALPDIEIPLYHFGLIKRRYFPSHTGWTPHLKTGKFRGIMTQCFVVALGVLILV